MLELGVVEFFASSNLEMMIYLVYIYVYLKFKKKLIKDIITTLMFSTFNFNFSQIFMV